MRHETLDSMKMISNLLEVKVEAMKVTSAWDAKKPSEFLDRLIQLEISVSSFREMVEEILKDEREFYRGTKKNEDDEMLQAKYEDEDRDPIEYTYARFDGK